MKLLSLILLVWSLHHEEAKCWVTFTINNAGLEVSGTVDSVRAIIRFHPSNLPGSYIEAWASAATVNTGISIRDKHLKRKDYFDVETFPVIHLKSKSFRKAGRNKVSGNFDLTIKGITRSVPVTFIRSSDGHSGYKAIFNINRLDFNLGEESMILENKVVIEVSVE